MIARRRVTVAICTTALAIGASHAERALSQELARAAAPDGAVSVHPGRRADRLRGMRFLSSAGRGRAVSAAHLSGRQEPRHADRRGDARYALMPPWKPEPGYGQFADERRLTGGQIATLRKWLDDGAIEGDPALLPSPPKSTGDWVLGEPDLVLHTPSYTLRASGSDVYRNFVLPIGTTQKR